MRRLLLDRDPDSGGRTLIAGRDAHYLSRVLRMGPGDGFRALSPGKREYQLRIVAVDQAGVHCVCEAGSNDSPDASRFAFRSGLPQLVLLQAWPKGQKLDLIVRQAVEAGVGEIIVFVGDHSVVKPSSADMDTRRERFERIAKEALQQSGAAGPCRIHTASCMEEALSIREALAEGFSLPLSLLMHQDTLAQNTLHRYLDSTPDSLAIAVGPEGGFSPRECALAQARGCVPFVLGPTVLRTETAALFALAAVEIIILERSSWQSSAPS